MNAENSENEKKVYWILRAINSFEKESACTIDNEGGDLHNDKALFYKKEDHYEIKVISNLDDTVAVFKEPLKPFKEHIHLYKNEKKLRIPLKKIKTITTTLSSPAILTYKAYEVFEPFEGDKFFRAIYFIDERPNFDGFPLKKVQINSISHYTYFKVMLNEIGYEVYFHKNDDLDLKYLLIETDNPTNLESFEGYINTIIYTISLFTGKFYRGGRYIVALSNYEEDWKENYVKYEYLGESILKKVNLLDPHACKTVLEKFGVSENDIKSKCRWMDLNLLSKIILNVHDNNKIYRIIDLINEGNSTSSLILRSGIYSIALETLTNLVYEQNKEKLNPIGDQELEKIIKDKFYSILDEYEHAIEEQGMDALKKKIAGLNRPANIDKLINSFSALGLRISPDDEKVIKYRNKFLHGSSPIRNFEGNDDKTSELYYIASHLHKLVTLLLLKFIGYEGHIKNIYAINYFERKKTLKESPIIII